MELEWDDALERWDFTGVPGPAGTCTVELGAVDGTTVASLYFDIVDFHRLVRVSIEPTDSVGEIPWLTDDERSQFHSAHHIGGRRSLPESLAKILNELGLAARLIDDLAAFRSGEVSPQGLGETLCLMQLVTILEQLPLVSSAARDTLMADLRGRSINPALLPTSMIQEVASAARSFGVEIQDFALPAFRGGSTLSKSPQIEARDDPDRSNWAADVAASTAGFLPERIVWNGQVGRFKYAEFEDLKMHKGTIAAADRGWEISVPARSGMKLWAIGFADGLPVGAAVGRSAESHFRVTLGQYGDARPDTLVIGPSPYRIENVRPIEQLGEAIATARRALQQEVSHPTVAAHEWESAALGFLGVEAFGRAAASLRRTAHLLDSSPDGVSDTLVNRRWARIWDALATEVLPELVRRQTWWETAEAQPW